jgi:hypothetical protein
MCPSLVSHIHALHRMLASYPPMYDALHRYVLYNALHEGNVAAVRARLEARFGSRCVGLDYQLELDPLLGERSVLRRFGITHLYTLAVGGLDDGSPRVEQLRGVVRARLSSTPRAHATYLTLCLVHTPRLITSPASAHAHPPPPYVLVTCEQVSTLVHAVFDGRTPRGDAFARISPCVPGGAPVVPHLVRRRDAHGPDLRSTLGIPPDATVFGRHGGYETFDISFARAAVLEVAACRPDIWFVLLNTAPLAESTTPPPNVIHLPATIDDDEKAAFVRGATERRTRVVAALA